MKIMTYNVCWEALEATKGRVDMSKCMDKTKNRCFANIVEIINDKLKQEYDFICLQEINMKQVNNMAVYLSLDNYNILKKEIFPAGIITLYHNKYKLIKKYTGNLIDSKIDRRPYIISLFTNNTVLVNIHMPHVRQYDAILILKTKLYKLKPFINKQTIFIICGDFNNKDPYKILSLSQLLQQFKQTIRMEPNIIKTCCVPNGTTYNLSIDHIFISSNAKYVSYKTITKKEKYMSDHIPLFCEIIFKARG